MLEFGEEAGDYSHLVAHHDGRRGVQRNVRIDARDVCGGEAQEEENQGGFPSRV